MKIIPKTTRDIKEYYRMEHRILTVESLSIMREYKIFGYYSDGKIWWTTLRSLLHELVHHILNFIFSEQKSGSLVLFGDFLNDILDFINGTLFHKEWRNQVHYTFKYYIVQPFNDWIDFISCRNTK